MTLIYTATLFLTAPVWVRIARAQHQRVLLLCEFNLYLPAYVEVNLDFSVNGQNDICDSREDFDGTNFNHHTGN